jgi:glycosyltransferase involved in cell wall biosynthesis
MTKDSMEKSKIHAYKFDVSIVIASIGRNSLIRVIDQILEDKENFLVQIIVVADGNEAKVKIDNYLFSSSIVEVIQNNRTKGVSGALNTGLHRAEGKYLMFFSDDDFWPKGKLKNSVNSILGKKNTCVCFQVETVSKTGKKKTRPSHIPKGSIDPLSYCYGGNPFLVNPHYISLTSFIAPIEVKEILFPENLNSREDLVWLDSLHNNLYEIFFEAGICARVEIGYERTTKRDDHFELSLWLEWLKTNKPDLQSNFLFSHFLRPYVVSGNILAGLNVLVKVKVWRHKPSLRNTSTFAFLLLAGSIKLIFDSIINLNVIKRIRKLLAFIVLQIKPHSK